MQDQKQLYCFTQATVYSDKHKKNLFSEVIDLFIKL